MKILVTGGAGYIGSHVVKHLGENTDHSIVILDNLSTGKKESVLYGELIECDLANHEKVNEVFKKHNFDAVIHFAASIVAPESVNLPLKYYLTNTVNTTHLLNICIKNKIEKFIFSSTAADYGEPKNSPVNESAVTDPINPYGMSKLMSEQIIKDVAHAYNDFNYIILRYFNVAGADIDGKIGQSYRKATHLIKLAAQTALNRRASLSIFGSDYATKDGTGIRDYIHVDDLADAHIEALNYLSKNNRSNIFNCGYGDGYSVKEVISVMQEVTGNKFEVRNEKRRLGDPSILIADNKKITSLTNWKPKYNDLKIICRTAFEWEKTII